MYLSSEQKESIISILRDQIPSIQALYLFGSYADGSAIDRSDIDIAYLCKDRLSSVERWDISQLLARKLDREIDLIELSQTNTIFRYQIILHGKRLFGSGYEVESFETLAFSFYLRFQEERKIILNSIYKDQKVLHV